ncbi:MAG: hypothetical protein RLZZ502_1204 [Pseudomonadota bacterium]|jgi:hypothetical protein
MAEASPQRGMETVFDWRAAGIAAVLASAIYLLLTACVNAAQYGNWAHSAEVISNHLGSDLYSDAMHLTQSGPWLPGLLLHFLSCVLAALVICLLVHEFGLLVGVVGGGVLGLCVWAIHFYAIAPRFEWMYALKGQYSEYLHVLYGVLAGGVYELLERARYVKKGEK